MSARVLVIEDHADSRALIGYLLRAAGHRALLACNGTDGIDMAVAERPEVILVDLHLPGMDGYETAARLRALPELDDVPLVAHTALAMAGDREVLRERGFDGYLRKLIEPESFAAQVVGYVGRRP